MNTNKHALVQSEVEEITRPFYSQELYEEDFRICSVFLRKMNMVCSSKRKNDSKTAILSSIKDIESH